MTNEAEIEILVRDFYARIRADETLGPIFARVIGEDWEPHLQKMFAFWSSDGGPYPVKASPPRTFRPLAHLV